MLNQLRNIEDGYMELFCKRKNLQDMAFFTNDTVPELYDHNFVLIESIHKEAETINFITSELKALDDLNKVHVKIVFHPNISVSEELRNIMNQRGFEVSDLYYMLHKGSVQEDWAINGKCIVQKAVTDNDIQIGVDCAIAYAAQRMPLTLAHKKVNQKKGLYRNGLLDLYICYVDGLPIGFCDWYEKDGIIKLEEVTILNKFQGKGFGTQMLKQLLYKAVTEHKKQVYIVTETGNEHNIYLQLGFQTVGMETEMFYCK